MSNNTSKEGESPSKDHHHRAPDPNQPATKRMTSGGTSSWSCGHRTAWAINEVGNEPATVADQLPRRSDCLLPTRSANPDHPGARGDRIEGNCPKAGTRWPPARAPVSAESERDERELPACNSLAGQRNNTKGDLLMELPPQQGAGPESTGNQNEEHEVLREEGPRIYVASLSDYNAGILHGDWIEADQELGELSEAVQAMLERSPTAGAEEFAIHDFEGFGLYRPGEYDSLDWISRVARGIVEHGPAFGAWADNCTHDDEALERFDDAYIGEWDSVAAYAEELVDDLGLLRAVEDAVPDMLQPYVRIDIDGFAHDLELSGDLTVVEHARGVWLFEGQF